ncbi:hypothetical protein RclHR1_10260005 [Rhizophagus clarus]|uniref:Uncharacterized protein n=1 Tax=Rhizophagus clarus TaxID=94130 RepID=A0A2Z6Q5P5_9GLOM|nr:hypothetical protein RclHR1_10260005 [Rhizophagus clarus]GET02820.1 hypothetical protein RCL_jg11784.t1 [Rhizophagus clarus]
MDKIIFCLKSSVEYITTKSEEIYDWAVFRICNNLKKIWNWVKSFFQQNDDSSNSSDSDDSSASSNFQQNDDSSASSNSPPPNINYNTNNGTSSYRRQKRYLEFRYVPIFSTR